MNFNLSLSETKVVEIKARPKYSEFGIEVKKGQQYSFERHNDERWCDFFIHCGPDGYSNPLASLFGMRVKGVKCFTLCGSYNASDQNAFLIGSSAEVTITVDGILNFFANDTPGFYINNSGKISMRVTRTQ